MGADNELRCSTVQAGKDHQRRDQHEIHPGSRREKLDHICLGDNSEITSAFPRCRWNFGLRENLQVGWCDFQRVSLESGRGVRLQE